MSTTVTNKTPASLPAHLTSSSIGNKILMAVTGFIAFGFVVGHMLGNLQVFIGQNQMNHYAETLQSLGKALWAIRVFLGLSIIIHIWTGIKLRLENWAARPIGYHSTAHVKSTLASRTMIWTGIIILSFVVYHLLHFTARTTDPAFANLIDAQGRYDVYTMVILGFSHLWISVFYIIAVGLLSYHLSHGVASMFQSLGLNSPKWQTRLKAIAWFFTIFLFAGYASIPLAVLTGLLTQTSGGM